MLKQVALIGRTLDGHGENGAVVGQDGAQAIVAAAQVFQPEGAVLTGSGFAHGVVVAQLDGFQRHTLVAGLAFVPQAVVVEIEERSTHNRALLYCADVFVGYAGSALDGKLAFKHFAGEDASQVAALGGIARIEHFAGQIGGDGIAVIRQEVEVVNAAFIGGDGTFGTGALAFKVNGHPGHAGLVLVHHAVVVHILKSLAGEEAHGTRAHGQFDRRGFGERHHTGGSAVAFGRKNGETIALGNAENHFIFARCGGDGGGALLAGCTARGNLAVLDQLNRQIGKRIFVLALFAVGVGVGEGIHAERGSRNEADIRLNGFAASRKRFYSIAIGKKTFAADGINGQLLSVEAAGDAVFARFKHIESIQAVGVGNGLGHCLPCIAVHPLQIERNAAHQLLAIVAHGVGISVHVGAAGDPGALCTGAAKEQNHHHGKQHQHLFFHGWETLQTRRKSRTKYQYT